MKLKSILLLPIFTSLLVGCSFDFREIFRFSSKEDSSNVSNDANQKEDKTSEESNQNENNDTQSITTTSFKITFNPGRGSGNMDQVEIEEGFYYKLPSSSFVAPLGESFVCWIDQDNFTYKAGKEVLVNEDMTFTAYYASSGVNVYTVSFSSNGGSGTMSSVEVEEGLYELPTCSFTPPSEKTFNYWSIPGSSTKYQPGNNINVTNNVTVSANWKNVTTQTYSITYLANGGSGSISNTVGEENTWVYLAYCTFTPPTNKEFDYWEVDGVAREEHTAIQLTKDFTAKAIWKDKTSTIDDDDYTLVDLDCGYKNIGIPNNKDNPIELRTTLSADASSWYNTSFDGSDTDYTYINGNNAQSNPSTYSSGNLKIDNKGKGFGSPYFNHEGAKLEIRIGIGEVHNASGSPKDKKKDVFRIYFFGENNNLLGQINIAGDTINQNTTEIKKYYDENNASQVKYFEFRCNEQPHNSSGSYMNVGISYCNIKSWERV